MCCYQHGWWRACATHLGVVDSVGVDEALRRVLECVLNLPLAPRVHGPVLIFELPHVIDIHLRLRLRLLRLRVEEPQAKRVE